MDKAVSHKIMSTNTTYSHFLLKRNCSLLLLFSPSSRGTTLAHAYFEMSEGYLKTSTISTVVNSSTQSKK